MDHKRTAICKSPSIIIKIITCSCKSGICINRKCTIAVKFKFISNADCSSCIAYSYAVEGVGIAGYSLCCSSIEVNITGVMGKGTSIKRPISR